MKGYTNVNLIEYNNQRSKIDFLETLRFIAEVAQNL